MAQRQLAVITWNVGDHGDKADLGNLMDRAPVLCLQEMSDRDGFYDYAQNNGWRTYCAGGDNGRKATPVFWDPDKMGPDVDCYCRELSPSTYAPGTGPDQVKPKYLIGVGWNLPNYDKQCRIGSLHLVSDSGKDNQKRRDLAHDQIVIASKMWKGDNGFPEGFCAIGGDWNTSWNNALLDPMRNQDWKSNHANKDKGGPITTHGKGWEPDQIWHRNGGIREMCAIKTGSDHKALRVVYNLP